MEVIVPTDWINGLLGGGLIGAAALLLFAGSGRIAGISGITYSALVGGDGGRAWRWRFLLGLAAGGWLAAWLGGGFAHVPAEALGGIGLLAVAGLIVGFGTALGNGCTSGHGVCGVSRWSPRSIAATVAFMAVGLLVATGLRPLLVGS